MFWYSAIRAGDTDPRKVAFRYKLEDRDKTWEDAGARRQAFYNDLPPGRYRFRVIASNNDGVWNKEGATLTFSIALAWYQMLTYTFHQLAFRVFSLQSQLQSVFLARKISSIERSHRIPRLFGRRKVDDQQKGAINRLKAPLATPSDIEPEAVTQISGTLNILLADVLVLYFKTKNFHWHMSGPHFRDYHLMLDEHADQIFAMTDEVAERVRKIGGTTLRSIGHVCRFQRLQDNNAEFVTPADMLSELHEDEKHLVLLEYRRLRPDIVLMITGFPVSAVRTLLLRSRRNFQTGTL